MRPVSTNEVPVVVERTMPLPRVESTAGEEPSVGTPVTDVVARITTTLEKSAPGFVQDTVIWVLVGVVVAPVTLAGEALSIVMTELEASLPAWSLVPVQPVTVLVTVYVEPGGAGILAWDLGVMRTLY